MAADSLSAELSRELCFSDPRCVALEIAKMAHDGKAPVMDCVLAGLRRLLSRSPSHSDINMFIDSLDDAHVTLLENPSAFRMPTIESAAVVILRHCNGN